MSIENPQPSTLNPAQRNGHLASASDLAPLAFAGYAHFTAMQVRGGQVRGLDLHLARLRAASQAMFDHALPHETILGHLSTALPSEDADVSLTATVYSPAGEFTSAVDRHVPDVLVRVSAPSNGPVGPMRMALVEHERMLPHLKHVGEIAKTYLLRQVVARGFDDAVFLDRQGHISEGTIWNIVFWDGQAVAWPRARMLLGTTMSIVKRQLEAMGIPQRNMEIGIDSLPSLKGAAVMNSWTPCVAVHQLGTVPMPEAPEFHALLHRAFCAEPLRSLQGDAKLLLPRSSLQ
ncbi:MAG: aminotransferase class IV family protein [Stenotrophomonas sp.]